MDEHRLTEANKITVIPLDPPFSSFRHVELHYSAENDAIRRLFSLARSHDARVLLTEEIDPAGMITEENDEIRHYVADYEMKGLERISFWRSASTVLDNGVYLEEDCIGYAIVKRDTALSRNCDEWHVYEAVFEKYPDPHNCVPNSMRYTVMLGGQKISVGGLLYAQQNGLNKACAQVALRSLISRINGSDISYGQINDLAQAQSANGFDPGEGLGPPQIRAVLAGFGIQFRDFDYNLYGDNERLDHPYQKYIYSGIESGTGALLGFHFTGPAIHAPRRHIIPFYGHTFNKDTWAPDADIFYFHVGERLGYVPSLNWTSSFLGHDDNFGPNYCVPRLYIHPKEVDYVVELLKPGIKFGGAQAEAMALQFLYSVLNQIIDQIDLSENIWLERLIHYAEPDIQRIVLRALAVDRNRYIQHLSNEEDWNQNSEHQPVIDALSRLLPEELWVVEVSIPQLFPANERKLGEIILNGGIELVVDQITRSHFLLVRLPGNYFFRSSDGSPTEEFLVVGSNLTSHLPVIKLD